MKYCVECGHELILQELENEGMIPYCPNCNEYRFPTFNSAISTVIFNKAKDKILLIQQYGRDSNILVAGYINKGENANEALLREVKEEVDLTVKKFIYNDNFYFERSNTLIHNFTSFVDEEEFHLTKEVDKSTWFSIDEAIEAIRPNSLAKQFLLQTLHKQGFSKKLFHYEENRIYILDAYDKIVAEITFPTIEDSCVINHTFVDQSLRGLGIASHLVEAANAFILSKNKNVKATCSYAINWLKKHK